jgi:beta-mannosidase
MEQGWCDWGWNKPDDPLNQRLKEGYDRMFHHLLPELLKEEDPDHPYWPSSASANTAFEGANNQVQGDCHYWDVWHGRKPFTAYRTQFPRFMSEFGFQALPPLKTIATYADPADMNMTSYIMEHHQRSWVGNGLIVAQMTDTFRMPKDFPSLVYLSLVLQAEGIRYGVEHWRRNRDRVSGTLIWQLNDFGRSPLGHRWTISGAGKRSTMRPNASTRLSCSRWQTTERPWICMSLATWSSRWTFS